MSPVIDDELFIDIYRKYYKKIFNFIFRHLFHVEKAEDLASEIFFKVYRYINKHKSDIKNIQAWLYRIATNSLINYSNINRKKIYLSIDEHKEELMSILIDNRNISIDSFTDILAIRQELSKLKQDEIVLVELYYFERLTYKEIAGILKVKETTLRSKMHRIINKLKEIFD